MQNNLTAGERWFLNLLNSEGSNGSTFRQNMLANHPLDNPLDPQYEKMKSIMDAQGPIDPLDVYEPYDPGLAPDPLTGIPGFDQVSVPYQVPDPWLVADANVPPGSDRFGGGANLNQPVPLEGPSDYQNRFKKAFPSGSPEAIEAETRADQLMNPHLWAT